MKLVTKNPTTEGVALDEAMAGALLMLGAAFVFAFLGVFIKMMDPRFRVWDIAMYRFLGGLLVLMVFFGARGNLFKPQNPALMLARGIVGALTFVCLVIAIRSIPFSTAMVFFYCFPVFSALFSAWLFKQRAEGREWLWIALALAGSAVLFDFRLEGGLFGQAIALLSGMLAGLTASMIKKLRESNGSAIIYFYMCLCGALIVLPFFINGPQVPSSTEQWLLTGAIVFTSVTAQLMMTQGYKYCSSWGGGVIMTTEVLFALVLGIALFAERMSWNLLLGGTMVVAGALGIQLKKRKTR